jgi:hypothetical protein
VSCIRVGSEKRLKGSGFICVPDETLVVPNPDCPNVAQHEPFPQGYLAASEYAEKLMETHTQEAPCPGCGLWLIWVPLADEVTP